MEPTILLLEWEWKSLVLLKVRESSPLSADAPVGAANRQVFVRSLRTVENDNRIAREISLGLVDSFPITQSSVLVLELITYFAMRLFPAHHLLRYDHTQCNFASHEQLTVQAVFSNPRD